jgi:hypothetical protein
MSPIGGKMTEAELQTSLVRCAREQGWWADFAWKSLHSPKGRPDLELGRGLFLCVWELKNETHKATPEQIERLDWWHEFAQGVEFVDAMARDHPAAPIKPEYEPRIHVALLRPADLEAAYWLLMGQRPTAEHPWPRAWDPSDPQRGKP